MASIEELRRQADALRLAQARMPGEAFQQVAAAKQRAYARREREVASRREKRAMRTLKQRAVRLEQEVSRARAVAQIRTEKEAEAPAMRSGSQANISAVRHHEGGNNTSDVEERHASGSVASASPMPLRPPSSARLLGTVSSTVASAHRDPCSPLTAAVEDAEFRRTRQTRDHLREAEHAAALNLISQRDLAAVEAAALEHREREARRAQAAERAKAAREAKIRERLLREIEHRNSVLLNAPALLSPPPSAAAAPKPAAQLTARQRVKAEGAALRRRSRSGSRIKKDLLEREQQLQQAREAVARAQQGRTAALREQLRRREAAVTQRRSSRSRVVSDRHVQRSVARAQGLLHKGDVFAHEASESRCGSRSPSRLGSFARRAPAAHAAVDSESPEPHHPHGKATAVAGGPDEMVSSSSADSTPRRRSNTEID